MYLIRLDDASDHMNIERWDRVERMLDASCSSADYFVGIEH